MGLDGADQKLQGVFGIISLWSEICKCTVKGRGGQALQLHLNISVLADLVTHMVTGGNHKCRFFITTGLRVLRSDFMLEMV